MNEVIQPLSFLKISRHARPGDPSQGRYCLDDYKPLLGLWLIDIARVLGWSDTADIESMSTKLLDSDFLQLTGLRTALTPLLERDLDDDALAELELDLNPEEALHAPVVLGRKRRLRKRRVQPSGISSRASYLIRQAVHRAMQQRRASLYAEFSEKIANKRLTLFDNIERLGRIVQLNDAEKTILTFAAAMSCNVTFRSACVADENVLSDDDLAALLTALSGNGYEELRKALRQDALLATSGLIEIDHTEEDLQDKIQLGRGLRGMMLDQFASDEELSQRVLLPAKPGTLTLAHYPHLQHDARLILAYLTGAVQTQAVGANVLLYGPPGTGKTEFAKALAAQAGLTLYEIGHADGDGNPDDGEDRLRNLNFCQRALAGKPTSAVLFDEIEDVLPGKPGGLLALFGFEKSETSVGKAWINHTLEANRVPTLWITNNTNIDPAYLRRFDYSLAVRIPPRAVRARIVAEHLGAHAPDAEALAALAELDDLMPAQLNAAARVARLSSHATPELAWSHAQLALQRSRALLGQTRKNVKAHLHTQYRLEYLNLNVPIGPLLRQLQARPEARLCLYGPSGTGKSQLARHIADALGKPIVVQRASDLLNKYVGGTEQRIAAMFETARAEDAVLLLDEADSFLSERSSAMYRWEVTQTNELLTQLECFDGIFFATTNLMDKLDPACLRRFSHKIRFDYLKPEQSWNMFVQELIRMGGDMAQAHTLEQQVRKLDCLTPGDFAVVARNCKHEGGNMTAAKLLELLTSEVAVKMQGHGRVGFV